MTVVENAKIIYYTRRIDLIYRCDIKMKYNMVLISIVIVKLAEFTLGVYVQIRLQVPIYIIVILPLVYFV